MALLESDENPNTQRLASIVRSLSQDLLLQKMRELGRKYAGSDTANGLDHGLWKAVVETPVQLTDEEASELEQMSQQAGGWWRLTPEMEFLELEAWQTYYSEMNRSEF